MFTFFACNFFLNVCSLFINLTTFYFVLSYQFDCVYHFLKDYLFENDSFQHVFL